MDMHFIHKHAWEKEVWVMAENTADKMVKNFAM